MSEFERLYNIFRAWIDHEKFGYNLRSDAPKEAVEALEKYLNLKEEYKKKGMMI